MGFHRLASFLLTSITAGLAAAVVLLTLKPEWLKETPHPLLREAPATAVLARESGPVSYADAVAKTAPSVVNIYAAKVTTRHQALQFKDPVLQYYFGKLLPEQTRKQLETSLGSGVIFNSQGYILTNHHVIESADEIRVVLANGRSVSASVIGSDPDSDLAVLKVEAENLPAITVGDSRAIKVGDVVLAIGNPFSVGQTVTMGIVSGLGRNYLGINTFENFIQTDAAINPGNSGGALVNARGELIGINTAIFSKSGGSHGIGFAIPVGLAKGVMEQLVRNGHVVRGWIGISGRNVTPDLVEAFGLHNTQGVLVLGVLEKGPADLAGLHAGDVIAQINGQPVNDIEEVLETVSNAGPGANVSIRFWRGDDVADVTMTTTERPSLQ